MHNNEGIFFEKLNQFDSSLFILVQQLYCSTYVITSPFNQYPFGSEPLPDKHISLLSACRHLADRNSNNNSLLSILLPQANKNESTNRPVFCLSLSSSSFSLRQSTHRVPPGKMSISLSYTKTIKPAHQTDVGSFNQTALLLIIIDQIFHLCSRHLF